MTQEFAVLEIQELTHCVVRILSDDIFHIKWNGDKDIEIQDIDELAAAFESMTQGRRMKVIQEFDHFTNITNDARKHAAETAPDVTAIAYVIKGLGQRMVLRFYLNLRRRKAKAKVFMKMEEALNWIEKC